MPIYTRTAQLPASSPVGVGVAGVCHTARSHPTACTDLIFRNRLTAANAHIHTCGLYQITLASAFVRAPLFRRGPRIHCALNVCTLCLTSPPSSSSTSLASLLCRLSTAHSRASIRRLNLNGVSTSRCRGDATTSAPHRAPPKCLASLSGPAPLRNKTHLISRIARRHIVVGR